MNYNKYIGMVHFCGMIMEDIYGFIIKKTIIFDKLYIFSFVAIPLSWIIFNDECIISYIIKKLENNNYRLGEEPENVNDISNLFVNEKQYLIFYHINNLLRIFSVIIVNKRTTYISYTILIPTCILYLYYTYDITYKLNYRKLLYPYFQIYFCCYLLIIFYKLMFEK
jgi:hypothetical protein